MSFHDVVVLFPGHGLEDFPTDLPDEKATGLLNAFAVTWHPAVLAAVKSLPLEHRADVPPALPAGRLIIVPPACDETIPADWVEQARAEGATVITGITERDPLVKALLELPGILPPGSPELDADLVADFSPWEPAGCSSSCSHGRCTISAHRTIRTCVARQSPRRKRPSPETSKGPRPVCGAPSR